MPLSEEFEDESWFVHQHEYSDNPSQEWLDQEKGRLLRLSDALGFAVVIQQAERGFAFGFREFMDMARFRVAAFDEQPDPGGFTHTEHFEGCDPEFQKNWVAAAAETLDWMDVNYEIVEDGTDVQFRFDTVTDHAVFVEMRDMGVFNDMITPGKSNVPGWHPSLN